MHLVYWRCPILTRTSDVSETTLPARGPGNESHTVPGLVPLAPEAKVNISILVIDDERTLSESCASVLHHEGYNVTACNRGDEALSTLERRSFDIVLVDLYMSQVSGLELLRACLTRSPETIVVVMTGNPSVASSMEALREGAWDYLPKPFSAVHLQILIGRAAQSVLVARDSRQMRAELQDEHGNGDGVLVLGSSPSFRAALELARRVAATDASVFITGESGSGKELFAQFIHHHSRRRSRQLVAINCAALPEPLLESEMFGHTKGSFTGATRDKPGLLETANGGTLFLDELTEMSQAIQAKLLRVIQDGMVRRVGSNNTDAVVSVRFVAATNDDPQQAVHAGRLRKDLYYRLRVVPIHVPPLRERREDIPVLAQHFLSVYWSRHRAGGLAMPRFGDSAMAALQGQPWRGNVRELQNVIEHAAVLLKPGAEIQPGDLPFLGNDEVVSAPHISKEELHQNEYHTARDRVIADFERDYLSWLVGRTSGNMSKAARIAGVDRTTLYRLMEKHGLQRDTIITVRAG